MKSLLPAACVALATSQAGCALSTSPAGDGSTGSSESPIIGGDPIDTSPNPISYEFPLMTVGIVTGTVVCTGVLITETLVLTAAHCGTNHTSQVYFYNGADIEQPGSQAVINAVADPYLPPGVTCPSLPPGEGVDATCWATDHHQYADLALLPLEESNSGNVVAKLGPAGPVNVYGTNWIVGVGDINANAGSNPHQLMNFTSVDIRQPDTGTLSQIITVGSPATHGDSGGPLFQYATPPAVGVGAYNLLLVGIASASEPTPPNNFDLYTSVLNQYNQGWIQSILTGPYKYKIAHGGRELLPRGLFDPAAHAPTQALLPNMPNL